MLARLLTPNDYGLISMVAVFMGFVSMFKDLGLSLATVQKAEITYDQISTLFWVNVAISCSVFVVVAAASPLVAWLYQEPRLTSITAVTAVGLIFGGLTVQHEALLKRQMRFFALSAISFFSMLCGYVIGIFMAWRGAHYWALVASQLGLIAANMVGVWVVCGWRPGAPKRNVGVRSMLAFGGNVTGYSAVNYFSRNSDSLLIGKFWGASQLGFYNRAVQLSSLPTDQINEPLSSVVIPALSRLASTSDRYRQGYLRIMEKVLLLTMPAVALMIVTADWLVQLVLGPQWTDASTILMFVGVAGLFQPIVNTGGWLLVTQGRTKEMLQWSLLSAPMAILAVLAGLRWGATGVAASYSLSRLLVMNPALFWFVGRSGPVRTSDFYRLLAPFLVASCASIGACGLFRLLVPVVNPFVGVATCGVVVGAMTLASLWIMPAGRAALRDVKGSMALLRPAPTP